MTFHYSKAFESLLEKHSDSSTPIAKARVVIVGSGYGGSIAAFRLSNREDADKALAKGRYDVMVLERGKEYALGEFPNDMGDLPKHVRIRRDGKAPANGNESALLNIHTGNNVDVLVGSGLGGTSLINANVAIQPSLESFTQSPWPKRFKKMTTQYELLAAFAAVKKWLSVADTEEDQARLRSLKKYSAFKHFAQALGYRAEPAPITVSLRAHINPAGIAQPECTLCGNCVTGCNVGAKNTLAMNLIPAAEACGACFFTGASVLSIQPVVTMADQSAKWHVHVAATDPLTRAKHNTGQPYFIEAEIVIVAAGALGSTEILKRSESLGFIQCSSSLGKNFSTNGDGIAMSLAQASPVHAMGARDFEHPPQNQEPGPTISGMAHGRTGRLKLRRYLLQDAAVPHALVRIASEVATTSALFGRLGFNRLPAWFMINDNYKKHDPLAVHADAMEHSQVFLSMGEQNNSKEKGELIFNANPENAQTGGMLIPTWVYSGNTPCEAIDKIDQQLAKHDREAGLNGGQYVPNPLWKLLPDAANTIGGQFPGGRLLTVHPLGGCAMGDSAATGVVDDLGRVFMRSGGVYEGLYVLDGAIIPSALGVNPFLTISALAWRACEHLAKPKGAFTARAPAKVASIRHASTPEAEQIVIREQLTGQLMGLDQDQRSRLTAAFPANENDQGARRWLQSDGLVLRLESDPNCTNELLSGCGSVRVKALVYTNPVDSSESLRSHAYGVPSAHLAGLPAIGYGTGELTVLQADYSQDLQVLRQRRTAAIEAYIRRRQTTILEKLLRLIVNWPLILDM